MTRTPTASILACAAILTASSAASAQMSLTPLPGRIALGKTSTIGIGIRVDESLGDFAVGAVIFDITAAPQLNLIDFTWDAALSGPDYFEIGGLPMPQTALYGTPDLAVPIPSNGVLRVGTLTLRGDVAGQFSMNFVTLLADENLAQLPLDGLAVQVAVIPDTDQDGILDDEDNCISIPNADQANADADGFGDACDPCDNDPDNDIDQDGFCADEEDCPLDGDKTASGECGCGVPDADSDGDGAADCNDPCPNDADDDRDEDGVCGDSDNCPDVANPDQADSDGDGQGDACQDPAGQPEPQNRPRPPFPPGDEFCGVCGAGGGSSVMLTLMGLLTLRLRPRRTGRRHASAGR